MPGSNPLPPLILGPLETNCYILPLTHNPEQAYLIDPAAEANLIIARLEAHNLFPRGIILTHGHLDHSSAAGTVQTYYSTNRKGIPLLAHREASPWCGAAAEAAHRREFGGLGSGGSQIFEALFEGIPEIDRFLEEGDTLEGTDLQVLETPGHSRCSICLYSPAGGFLLSGDTLFRRGAGRTDLTGGDARSLEISLRRLLTELPGSTRIFPGHGPETTIASEAALYGLPS